MMPGNTGRRRAPPLHHIRSTPPVRAPSILYLPLDLARVDNVLQKTRPHQRRGAPDLHVQHPQQGVAWLRALQSGHDGEVPDDLPGRQQFRLCRRRRQDAGDAAGLYQGTAWVRRPPVAWAAGTAAEGARRRGRKGVAA